MEMPMSRRGNALPGWARRLRLGPRCRPRSCGCFYPWKRTRGIYPWKRTQGVYPWERTRGGREAGGVDAMLCPRLAHSGFPRVSFEKVGETLYKDALLKRLSVTPLSCSGLPTAITVHSCPPALLLGPGLPQPDRSPSLPPHVVLGRELPPAPGLPARAPPRFLGCLLCWDPRPLPAAPAEATRHLVPLAPCDV